MTKKLPFAIIVLLAMAVAATAVANLIVGAIHYCNGINSSIPSNVLLGMFNISVSAGLVVETLYVLRDR